VTRQQAAVKAAVEALRKMVRANLGKKRLTKAQLAALEDGEAAIRACENANVPIDWDASSIGVGKGRRFIKIGDRAFEQIERADDCWPHKPLILVEQFVPIEKGTEGRFTDIKKAGL